jgi:nitrogen fixation protein NifZ
MDKFEMGEMVFATIDLYNDDLTEDGASMIPDVEPNALLAAAGSRGVVVNVGHVAEQPQQAVYLVRFETGPDKTLGLPIGCMTEELTNSA